MRPGWPRAATRAVDRPLRSPALWRRCVRDSHARAGRAARHGCSSGGRSDAPLQPPLAPPAATPCPCALQCEASLSPVGPATPCPCYGLHPTCVRPPCMRALHALILHGPMQTPAYAYACAAPRAARCPSSRPSHLLRAPRCKADQQQTAGHCGHPREPAAGRELSARAGLLRRRKSAAFVRDAPPSLVYDAAVDSLTAITIVTPSSPAPDAPYPPGSAPFPPFTPGDPG